MTRWLSYLHVFLVGWTLAAQACGGELAAASAGTPVHWNCFRGPLCGVSPWDNAPVAWDGPTGKGVRWKTPLKIPGVSSPVLWGDRLFITEADDRERAVLAFDARDGKLLWRRVVADGGEGAPLPAVSDYGLAMPTATCDANGVYTLFGTGDLGAFSLDGEPQWRMFLKRPILGYGFASSPCAVNHLLCVQYDHHASGRVFAVDTATGKIIWDRERSRGASWSSLMIVPDVDGKPLVVANANGSTTAYDLTGEMAWDVDGATGEVAPSPAWWDGRVYAVNVGSRLYCHRVHGTVEQLWDYVGRLSETASPVAVDGLLFMTNANGFFTCLDATTGERVWTERIAGGYASLLSSGGRIYALARNGTMQIVAAERTYRPIATCALGEDADATPAMTADGRMFIRGSKHLWCIDGKTPGEP
ncbi:MAG: PQQ-binding-like beta-propeller repeat protein [Phycisphaerae bacterium]|nr:PQQ-binding-like beta-propeller repeat protein [Phycisphaerae bacterium]